MKLTRSTLRVDADLEISHIPVGVDLILPILCGSPSLLLLRDPPERRPSVDWIYQTNKQVEYYIRATTEDGVGPAR